MEFDSVVNKRHSVRSFKSKKPSWKLILEAIDSATKVPFAGNICNLKFVIIEDKKVIKNLSKCCQQSWIKDVGVVVMVCSDDTHLENKYGERGRLYSKQQSGAAIQNFLLKLVDLGLCACWIGAYTDETARSTLKIPSHIEIEAIIPIGYEKPDKTKPKKRKQELKNVIFWEEWGKNHKKSPFEEPLEEPINTKDTRQK